MGNGIPASIDMHIIISVRRFFVIMQYIYYKYFKYIYIDLKIIFVLTVPGK